MAVASAGRLTPLWVRSPGCVRFTSRQLLHSSCSLRSHTPTQDNISLSHPVTVSIEGTEIFTVPIASPVAASPPLSTPVNLDPLPSVERPPPPDEGWLKRTLRKYLKGNMMHTGEVLAKTAFKHCENPEFRAKLGLPDNLVSLLHTKALHVWMLQQRIHEDVSPHAEEVLLRLYDMLWMDMENVLNKNGYLVLNKHKQNSQSAVYGSLVTYDKTLQVAAETGDYAPYLSALWRSVYSADRNLNKNHLVQMRDYIVEQRMLIRGVSQEDFYSGFVSFGEPGPVPQHSEAESLTPEVALKPFFEPGSDELKYNFPRSPLRSAKFVVNPLTN